MFYFYKIRSKNVKIRPKIKTINIRLIKYTCIKCLFFVKYFYYTYIPFLITNTDFNFIIHIYFFIYI